ncbi:SAM-dependent methyltransferase [Roseovarius sp. MBR-78]|jgi:SAM-dependent methyltransferase|uniref:hypothetical protein n=1 Tax=Roseovarius sp. MBR-78 TaxID=3156460 RepID=UPI00339173F1
MKIHDPVAVYVAAEEAAYDAAARERPHVARRQFPKGKQRIWHRRIERLIDWHREGGFDLPAALMRPYALPVMARVSHRIPLKYQYRGLNALRELARAHVMFPEITTSAPLSVLDLSAGGCGVADVYGHYGHRVTIRDYFATGPDGVARNPYEAIHREVGLDCAHFDGRARPYGFDSGGFDLVLCHQALDAYGPVASWPEAVAEMLRIARHAVGLVFNPPAPRNPETEAEAAAFVETLRVQHQTRTGICPETGLLMLRIDRG